MALERAADMRYRGQEHTVSVPVPPLLRAPDTAARLVAAFHRRHDAEYRHHASEEAVEIVSVRVSAIGRLDKPRWPELPASDRDSTPERRRAVWFAPAEGPVDTPVVLRFDLRAGTRRHGPLIVEEEGSVTCVPPGASLEVDPHANLVITW
jgi:N-methylhydantoinase A